jgi:hydrogenase expression/formation protein HypC
MCLGIPGQVVTITDQAQRLAKVDVNGVQRVISIRLLDAEPVTAGEWVLVHVGFALARIDEREAEMTLQAMRRLGRAYDDELDAFTSSGLP